MTRFFVRVGLLLMVGFVALGMLVGVAGGVLPYDGEIRYLGFEGRGFYAIRSIDLVRGITREVILPVMGIYDSALSSDGAYFWFTNADGTFVFNIETQQLQLVYEEAVRIYWLHNSPEVILVFFPDIDSLLRIFRVNVDGSNFRELILTERLASCGGLDISPDDSQIVFDGCSVQDSSISFINADGTNYYRLPETFSDTFFPSWSPDGRYIAFTQRGEGVSEINISNPDGGGRRNLVSRDGIINDFQWSPDSTAIATIVRPLDGDTEAVIATIDGQSSSVSFISAGATVEWSPDGRVLMTTASPMQGNFNYSFAFYNPSNLQMLYATQSYYGHVWSGDGSLFAYITPNYNELCILNVADWSTRRCVTAERPSNTPYTMIWLP
jgi:hypothetical protein